MLKENAGYGRTVVNTEYRAYVPWPPLAIGQLLRHATHQLEFNLAWLPARMRDFTLELAFHSVLHQDSLTFSPNPPGLLGPDPKTTNLCCVPQVGSWQKPIFPITSPAARPHSSSRNIRSIPRTTVQRPPFLNLNLAHQLSYH